MQIGNKIRSLRSRLGWTQEKLADQCDLSKGFISQLENDLTSPSITTLMDILKCLGTNIRDFFNDTTEDKFTYSKNDYITKEKENCSVTQLVPVAQVMEPVLLELYSGCSTEVCPAHEGEEFGYVLSGHVEVLLGDTVRACAKGECFRFEPNQTHALRNSGRLTAKVLWITTPPNLENQHY